VETSTWNKLHIQSLKNIYISHQLHGPARVRLCRLHCRPPHSLLVEKWRTLV